MNKPEKKKTSHDMNWTKRATENVYAHGYNKACDDWEEWCKSGIPFKAFGYINKEDLPTEKEIANIMNNKWSISLGNNRLERFSKLAKAIHKRINGYTTSSRNNQ